eukprot:TRINITY_DN4415_c0_g1_i2.p1 TRINITY_DN4415_c0_g1~~TRINITY_DN4415_c0_g1_i2.p1  ORF type:complete len:1548 (-),score=473.01 TRINITY_DN4415_c0_g1_i2:3448-8019(-)
MSLTSRDRERRRSQESDQLSGLSLLSTVFLRLQEQVANAIIANFTASSQISSQIKISPEEQEYHLWQDFPRNCRFYQPLLVSCASIGASSIESATSLFLRWLPQTSATKEKPSEDDRFELSFSTFYHSLIKPKLARTENDEKRIELARVIVELVVADLLSILMEGFQGDLSTSTMTSLRDLAFQFFRPTQTRHVQIGLWDRIHGHIMDQWALILGAVSPYFLRAVMVHLDKVVKSTTTPIEEQISIFRGCRFTRFNLDDMDRATQVEEFIDQMVQWIEMPKKPIGIRAIQIEILEHAVQTVNLPLVNAPIDRYVAKLKDLSVRAFKLTKVDGLGPSSVKLITCILMHSPTDFFENNVENILEKLLKGVFNLKKKTPYLECLLKILQGRYISRTGVWTIPRQYYQENKYRMKKSGTSRKKELQETTMDSPFLPSNLRLAENRGKMMKRLEKLFDEIFSKKTTVPRIGESLQVLSDILVHSAVYNLNYFVDHILPWLTSEKIYYFQLLAIKTLRQILNPKNSEFWETANFLANTEKNTKKPVQKEEIEKLFEGILGKILQICNEEVGLETFTLNSGLVPTAAYDQTEYPLRFDFVRSTMDVTDKKVQESVKRWYDIVMTSPRQRDAELREKITQADVNVSSIINVWNNGQGLDMLIMFRQYPERSPHSLLDLSQSFTQKLSRKSLAEKIPPLDLYKEAMRCIDMVPILHDLPNSSIFIGRLVLHEDLELAQLCSQAIQRTVIRFPHGRVNIIQGYLSLLMEYDYRKPSALYTLLSQLLLVLDLWIERTHVTDVEQEFSFDPNQTVVNQTEAIAVLHLSNCDPVIRNLCLNILQAISLTKEDDKYISIWSTLMEHEENIVQRARYQYYLEETFGIQGDIKLETKMPRFSIEEVAMSYQNEFWTFVLGEIGKICVDEGRVKVLVSTRTMLLKKLGSTIAAPPSEITSEEHRRLYNYAYYFVWLNYQTLLFSIAGVGLYTSKTLTVKRSGSLDVENDTDAKTEQLNLEQSIQFKLNDYLSTLWPRLESAVDWVCHAIELACSFTHKRSFLTLVSCLSKWFSEQKSKRQSVVASHVTRIMRNISQRLEFGDALREQPQLVPIYVAHIEKMEELFGPNSKKFSVFNTQGTNYFNNYSLIIANFCAALYHPAPIIMKVGPIRRYLGSTWIKETWPPAERAKLYKLLLQWSGFGELSQSRATVEKAKYQKALSNEKDPIKREEKRKQLDRLVRNSRVCSRMAIEGLHRLGPFDTIATTPGGSDQLVARDIIDWLLDAEGKGFRILKWFLAFHFARLLPFFIDKSYGAETRESVLFIHALYDQFLPSVSSNSPPTNGISEEIARYFLEKERIRKISESSEVVPSTIEDEVFADAVIQNAGAIIHLALFNLNHPAFLIRSRSYEIVTRLAPVAFGFHKTMDIKTTAELRKKLENLRNAFNTKIIATSKHNAIEVSKLTAKGCYMFSEALFTVAFARLKVMEFHYVGKKVDRPISSSVVRLHPFIREFPAVHRTDPARLPRFPVSHNHSRTRPPK